MQSALPSLDPTALGPLLHLDQLHCDWVEEKGYVFAEVLGQHMVLGKLMAGCEFVLVNGGRLIGLDMIRSCEWFEER